MSYRTVILILGLASLTLVSSVLGTFGLFYVAMVEEFGWSRAGGSSGFAVVWLLYAVYSPLLGWVVARIGIRPVMSGGIFVLALALGLSATVAYQWQYMLYFGVLGGAGFTAATLTNAILIPRWFQARRGMAMGITGMAYGLGPLILFPLLQRAIASYGWRDAMTGYAGVLVLLGIVIVAMVRENPSATTAPAAPVRSAAAPVAASWKLSDALRSRRYWALFFMYVLGFLGYQLLTAHQVAHADAVGFDRPLTAAILGAMGAVTMVGSLLGGFSSDRWGREPVFFLSSLLGATGVLALAALAVFPGVLPLLIAYALVSGLGFGMRLPLVFTVAADVFMGPSFARVMGVLGMATALGGFLGPVLAGYIYDVTESYMVALFMSAGALALSGSMIFIVAPRKGGFAPKTRITPAHQPQPVR